MFVAFIVAFLFLFGLLDVILLKLLNRPWYEQRYVRRAAWTLPLSGVLTPALWALGEFLQQDWLAYPMAALSALTFVLEIALLFSLPVSGLFHFAHWLSMRRPSGESKAGSSAINPRRRDFLKGVAAVVPAAAVATGVGGVVRSFESTRVETKIMRLPGLPSEWEGLRILHMSDLHLHHYVNLHSLERILAEVEPYRPDLVCMIGDVADDLRQLPDALSLTAQLKPRLGTVATLGNHEYFRGIAEVRRIFDRSPVPLLINDHLTFSRGETECVLAGIDDPRGIRSGDAHFYRSALDTALPEASSHRFTLLLSHRPDVFPYAAERQIPLSLAGHTHGGQVGFMGRSAFESWMPDKFLWGKYTQDQSLLYTSSGAGHWFPFRFGCPAEAPVIELRRA